LIVADNTVAVDISLVSEHALAADSIVALVVPASSAGIKDPVVSVVAVALSVHEVSIESAVLVAAASSVDDSISCITDAAFGSFIVVGVEGAFNDRLAFTINDGVAVGAHALTIDVGGAHWAEGLAVSIV
jgi:hypothetical protein